jgi:hypothetical protein
VLIIHQKIIPVKGDQMDGVKNSFCWGAAYGFIAAGLISLVFHQIREARLKTGLKNLALDKFPDAAQPGMTSAGVVKTSKQAALAFIMWSLVLVTVIGLVAAGVYFIAL